MDTITKVILGALAAVFAACATIVFIVTRDGTVTMVFAGAATSCVTALAGISYGSRLSQPVASEILETSAPVYQTPQPPIQTPPASA
jgi:hypothetical protein